MFLVEQLWDPTANVDEAYADIGEDAELTPHGSPESLAWLGRALAELGEVAHDSLSEKLATDGAATEELAAKIEAVIEAGGRAKRTGRAAVACSADDEVLASEACRGAWDKLDSAVDEMYDTLEPWEQELYLGY
jgi:hypothetical protein